MIYELGQNDYKLLKPMLGHGFQFPEAAAVVELNNVGKVFVDDVMDSAKHDIELDSLSDYVTQGSYQEPLLQR